MRKRRLFITTGQCVVTNKNASGIVDKVLEEILTSELRKLVVKELLAFGICPNVDGDKFVTYEEAEHIKSSFGKDDIAITLHFNSHVCPTVKGSEVIIPFKRSEFEIRLGNQLSYSIAKTLDSINRGVKTEADSTEDIIMFVRPNCENLLVEVCFISNSSELEIYRTRKELVAKVIAKCIFKYISTDIPKLTE